MQIGLWDEDSRSLTRSCLVGQYTGQLLHLAPVLPGAAWYEIRRVLSGGHMKLSTIAEAWPYQAVAPCGSYTEMCPSPD